MTEGLKRFTTSDGLSLAYRDEGAGETLLCLPGLTRQMILDICAIEGIEATERNLSLTELYTADEVFTSGTMGELTPVLRADGRVIGDGSVGETTRRLQRLHRKHAFANGVPLPF